MEKGFLPEKDVFYKKGRGRREAINAKRTGGTLRLVDDDFMKQTEKDGIKPEIKNKEEVVVSGERDRWYSSNFHPLKEQTEKPFPPQTKISKEELKEMADELVKSALGEDVFERNDKYPLQDESNELMKKISSESLGASKELNEKYRKLMFAILGDGSKDYDTAKEINNNLKNLYEQLQDEIKANTKLGNFDYQRLYEENPDLKDAHEHSNALIKKINGEALGISKGLHEKYNKVIVEELERFGTGATNIEDAESLNNKLEGIYDELQREISETEKKQEN